MPTAARVCINTALTALWLTLAGCSNLLFYPMPEHVFSPDQLDIAYDNVAIPTSDGLTLHAWLLRSKVNRKGVIYYLHGNAENISTHIASVIWLPAQGYDVLCLDYRGFGKSEGSPDLAGAIADANAGYDWLLAQENYKNSDKFLLGQSIGGAILVAMAGNRNLTQDRITGLIIDAAPSGFRAISREKLGELWLTWPLQYPLSWLITNEFEPIDRIGRLSPTPTLFIHSKHDAIVPYHHGQALFARAGNPKWLLTTETPHSATFAYQAHRNTLLKFLDNPAANLEETLHH